MKIEQVVPGLMTEMARTNSILQSRDFDTTWTSTGVVLTQNQTGIDGQPNRAFSVQDDSGSVVEEVYQDVSISDDSNTHVASVSIGKDSDETRFPEVQFHLKNGSSPLEIDVQVNTKTGATVIRNSIGTVDHGIVSEGNFWRLWLSITNNSTGNTTAQLRLFPASSTTWDALEASATGTAVFDQAQLELDVDPVNPFPSSPIPTTTIAVERAAEILKYQRPGHLDLTRGTIAAEISNFTYQQSSSNYIITTGSGGRMIYGRPSTYSFYDGVNLIDGPTLGSFGFDGVASRWGDSLARVATNGTLGTEGSFDGSLAEDTININHSVSGFFGNVRKLKLWRQNLPDDAMVNLSNYGENIGAWQIVGNNIEENDNGALKVTHVDHTNGGQLNLDKDHGLNENLVVGDRYRLTFDVKVTSGDSVDVKLQNTVIGNYTNTAFETKVYDFTALAGAYIYFYFYDAGSSVWIDNITIEKLNVADEKWNREDIGEDYSDTGSHIGSGTLKLEGGGDDIWGTEDEFSFLYQQTSGNFNLKVKVVSLEDTHQDAKGGIMIRETLDDDSKHAHLMLTYDQDRVYFQYRTSTSQSTSNANNSGAGFPAPIWLMLERIDDTIRGSYSTDGSSYVLLDEITVDMTNSVYVGLTSCSSIRGTLCTAEFDDFEFEIVSEEPYIDVLIDWDAILEGAEDFDEFMSTPGKNLIVVETAADGDKFIRFQHATLYDTRTWRLTGLLYDTIDTPLFDTYGVVAVDDPVGFYASLPYRLTMLPIDKYRTIYFKPVSFNFSGEQMAIAFTPEISEDIDALCDIPLAPWDLRINGAHGHSSGSVEINSGDLEITWKSRNRHHQGVTNYNDSDATPEDSDFVEFVLEVYDGSVKRTIEQTGKSYTYTSSDQSADGVGNNFDIRVKQRGALKESGYATVDVTVR
jgi:regulation of enolase protein 1 (concanavalin A-like superfamily)